MGDILEMLVERFGEGMAAGAVGDEIDFLRRRRIGDCLERGAPGIADRPRRQSGDDVSVVGSRLLQFRPGNRMAERALAEHQSVDDRRIGLELHVLAQAVDEHARDPRPLVGLAGLLLDDRSEGDEFARRLDRQILRALGPDFVDRFRLRLFHHREQGLASHAPRELVSLGQDRAFARRLLDLAEQDIVVAQPLRDLVAGQALRNGQRMQHDLAGNQLHLDVMQADIGLERIFAALQSGAAAVEQRHRPEPQRAVDHAGALELVADRPGVVLALDDDDLVDGERTRLARLDHRPDDDRDAEHAHHQREGEHAGKAGKAGATPAAGRLGRRRLAVPGAVSIAVLAAAAEQAHARRGLRGGARLRLVALVRRLVHPVSRRLVRQRQSSRICGEMKWPTVKPPARA